MTTTQIAFWTLIVAIATPVIYLGQLVVLILVYLRVIRETDRNAEIRRQEIVRDAQERKQELERNARERQAAIDQAGEMMRTQGEATKQGLNRIAKRNTIGLAVMGACIVGVWWMLRTEIRKFERITKHDK